MEIRSDCNCGRFENYSKERLIVCDGEGVPITSKIKVAKWSNADPPVYFCDGCGEKIWVEEENEPFVKNWKPFPSPLYDLEKDKEIPQDYEIKLNRLAINWLMQWVKNEQEAKNGGD